MTEQRDDLTIGVGVQDRTDPRVVTITTTGHGRLKIILRGHGVLFEGDPNDIPPGR